MQAPSNEHQASAMVQKFLDRPRKESTQRFYKSHLKLFTRHVGTLRVCDLRARHLTELLDRYPGANYRHNIARAAKTCFKWLADNEHIAASPFNRVPTPPAQSRNDEAYLTPEQWAKIIESVEGDLRDILEYLRETGCRPQEARRLEARHVEELRCVLSKGESKGGQVQRVIHLDDRAAAICRRLSLKHPTGPLFRDGRGRPWTAKTLSAGCRALGFTPYQIRHTFATEAIIRGVDLQTIAVLMGHSDLRMLSRVYQHVRRCDSHLRASLERATA
jgi:integrase